MPLQYKVLIQLSKRQSVLDLVHLQLQRFDRGLQLVFSIGKMMGRATPSYRQRDSKAYFEIERPLLALSGHR
jgi:hypothetical protein